MKRVAIVLNPFKQEANTIAEKCKAICIANSTEAVIIKPGDVLDASYQLLIVLGGDGTILHAISSVASHGIPILGINLGRVGFLTEVEPSQIEAALTLLFKGEYTLERRMLMQLKAPSGQEYIALNDVVLSRGTCARMIALDAFSSNTLIDHYIADGLIISTPTGSTAYSLSAGGPIVHPGVACFILSPICPHSLQSRPIVLSDREVLTIKLNSKESREGMIVTIDGQNSFAIENNQAITISRAPHDIPFIRFERERNFYNLLRTKLTDWSL